METPANTHTDTSNSPNRQRAPQPIDAATNPDALLNVDTVKALAGFGRSKIYALEAEGRFPQAVRMGTRCTRWRAGDITDWLKAQKPSAPTTKATVATSPKARW